MNTQNHRKTNGVWLKEHLLVDGDGLIYVLSRVLFILDLCFPKYETQAKIGSVIYL